MRAEVWNVITDRIIALLETGTVPWRKPWNAQAGMPKRMEILKHLKRLKP